MVVTWTRMILGGGGEKWLDSGYILKGIPMALTDSLIGWNVGCDRRGTRMIPRSWA